MLNVRLAGDHLYGKLLFTWLSLVVPLMVSWMRSGTEKSQFLTLLLSTLYSFLLLFGDLKSPRTLIVCATAHK